jgi:hypothetical protein
VCCTVVDIVQNGIVVVLQHFLALDTAEAGLVKCLRE